MTSDTTPGRPGHDPWLAVNRSLLFPGLGQLALGQPLRGIAWLLVSVASLGGIFWAYLAPRGNVYLGAGLIGTGFMLWLLNLVDAHACAQGGWQRLQSFGLVQTNLTTAAQPEPGSESQPRAAHRLSQDPWFLAFLSQLWPGLGQLYRGEYVLALIFLLLSLVMLTWLSGQLGLILGIPALEALAIYQICASQTYTATPLSSPGPSQGSAAGRRRPPQWQRRGVELALLVFLGRSLMFATVPLLRQVVEPFVVPSESMLPTLRVGDRILVRKQANYRPQPQDIIVFRDPTSNQERYFVKRVIGLGSDRIEVKQQQTYRNGTPLTEPYLNEPPRYRWDSQTIPPRHLIVLGDNRNESFDSSRWGPLPQSQVVGRAYRISWPPERDRPLP